MISLRFSHIGEVRKYTFSGPPPHRRGPLFCMGASAQCRGNCSKARTCYGAWITASALSAPARGSPSTSGKRRAWTSPSCSVLHSGRRSDRNLASSRDQAQAKAAAGVINARRAVRKIVVYGAPCAVLVQARLPFSRTCSRQVVARAVCCWASRLW
jgi:hypothetical protein